MSLAYGARFCLKLGLPLLDLDPDIFDTFSLSILLGNNFFKKIYIICITLGPFISSKIIFWKSPFHNFKTIFFLILEKTPDVGLQVYLTEKNKYMLHQSENEDLEPIEFTNNTVFFNLEINKIKKLPRDNKFLALQRILGNWNVLIWMQKKFGLKITF